ncbi:amidohydrolase family protein [Nocardioides sp. LHD-245]|uniref:amidohydrolase family protein n=1 Tax=Nocardioides sp. LHD-245 TaxID=3051387 RepID=UPI0027E10E91|nr:amidohydrolase family protein [Nocardioides sp. LHD-245]
MAIVDVHAHFFPRRVELPVSGGPWPRLEVDDAVSGRLLVGERLFRDVRAGLWDLDVRLAELDVLGVERQLVSPVPVTLDAGTDAEASIGYYRSLNDGIAEAVVASSGRLAGLGGVPWLDVDLAVAELRHAVCELGLLGIEIGCRMGERELDDLALRPLFAAAEELGALVFVHPLGGGDGAIRRSGEQPYDFGLGMLTDTAMAASALVFGGVLDACPGLDVLLAHGGGTFPWAFPRLASGSVLGGDRSSGDHAALLRRLWVDTLVLVPEHLGLLARRFGAEHVLVGSDYPFIPGQLEGAERLVGAAVAAGDLTAAEGDGLLGRNAGRLSDALGAWESQRG